MWLFHPLLLLIAKSTDSELARQVEYLKAENQILRKRVTKQLRLDEAEKRRLVKLGQAAGIGPVDGRLLPDLPPVGEALRPPIRTLPCRIRIENVPRPSTSSPMWSKLYSSHFRSKTC
jgi:hypothetical protein